MSTPNLGKVGVVKGLEAKKINSNKLDNYLKDGWSLGQPHLNKRKEA